MNPIASIFSIARWEVKKSLGAMTRDILPLAIVLFILLVIVTGFAAQSGMHLQDGMYQLGTDSQEIAGIFAGDSRFNVHLESQESILRNRAAFDVVIFDGHAYGRQTDRSASALKTLQRDYAKYVNSVYNRQEDLFAAYPLWIDQQEIKSELTFLSTQSGQYVSVRPGRIAPVPEGPVVEVPTPIPTIAFTVEELRTELERTNVQNTQVSRYTDIVAPKTAMGNFKTPAQLSPPLPFDTIILVFVFIFPLYFMSQFFMMSIMQERIERRGEVLLSTPIRPVVIVIGKMLPFLLGMLIISTLIALWMKASLIVILPLVPVILFFLANALLIGMISRSFKELSFVSIFFSTVATSYLFFPSIFANVHIISLVSPLTLIVLQIQGTGFTAMDYLYSTSLFWLTSAVIFWICVRNFREERLFSEHGFLTRIREFIADSIPEKSPYLGLFALSALSIPFIFMVQMMLLVLFFNLPMPYSLILLLVAAAFVEELAKSLGIYALFRRDASWLTGRALVIAAAAVAIGFLFGEKLLLFVTLAQISDSVFGSVLFTSLQVLWMPFLLHFAGVLVVGAALKYGGRRGYIPGLAAATAIHCAYNLYFILGWLG